MKEAPARLSCSADAPYGPMPMTCSYGISTSRNVTSWLPLARSPNWSQRPVISMPGEPPGTRNVPTRGSGSSVVAHTRNQSRPSAPVTKRLVPLSDQPSGVRRASVEGSPPRAGSPTRVPRVRG